LEDPFSILFRFFPVAFAIQKIQNQDLTRMTTWDHIMWRFGVLWRKQPPNELERLVGEKMETSFTTISGRDFT
jgi:hypothetical protein